MRIAIGAVIFLTMAVGPAGASEVFIAQSTNKAVSTEQAAASSVKTIQSAAMLAFPMQLKAVNSPIVANATTNTSALVQIGTNNVSAVSQTGGGNASSVVQHGNGNQATVTQRH